MPPVGGVPGIETKDRYKGRNEMQNSVKHFASAVAFFGATFGWSLPSDAGIQKIVIDQTLHVTFSPIPLNSSINTTPTPYTVYQGRIFGTLDPNDSLEQLDQHHPDTLHGVSGPDL